MRPDFSLIWGADNAPFTPIEASDYTAGWVFRTGAPPRRVNFDYWQNLSDQRTAWLAGAIDSVRIDVASASTVNLTTAAPDTRGIRITGTTTINGFTAAAGVGYFVTFSGVLTLANGASLVTNTGANIVTAPGDTCIIRATAENAVEILCGDFRADKGLGYQQTWQDVTGSRGAGPVYTNTTGKPIIVSIVLIPTVAGSAAVLRIDGVVFDARNQTSTSYLLTLHGVVPAGSTYSLTDNINVAIQSWREYR